MKKLVVLVIIAVLAVGIGLGVKKVTNQAGNPPVGAVATYDVADSGFTTMGNPPVG